MVTSVQRFIVRDGTNTAGGNGSTNGNTGADRAYFTPTEWEAAEQTDLDNYNEVTVSGISGTFQINEPLSLSPSSATAVLKSLDGTTMVYDVTSGTPTTADDITGDDSTATADIDTIDDTAGGTHTVTCSGGDTPTTDGDMIISGWVTVTGVTFITFNGENKGLGAYDDSAFRMEYTQDGNYQEGIGCREVGTIVKDMQIEWSNDSNAAFFVYEGNQAGCEFHRNIAVGIITGSPGGSAAGFKQGSAAAGLVIANLAVDFLLGANKGFNLLSTTTPLDAVNNTAFNCRNGFSTGNGDSKGINLLAQGSSTNEGFDTVTRWITGTRNNCSEYTDDPPGTNEQEGDVTFVGESSSPKDLRPIADEEFTAGLGFDHGLGDFDLTNTPFSTSADGFSIGCLIPAAAAGGASKLVVLNRNRGR